MNMLVYVPHATVYENFSEIAPRGSWVRGLRMTDMPDSPVCAPEWLQLCKLSVMEDSQISYVCPTADIPKLPGFFINLMALKEWLNVTLCWISLNTNDFGLPSLWISSYTSAQRIFYCGFFFVWFWFIWCSQYDSLTDVWCTHLPVYHFVVVNFVHSVLSWTEILIFYLIKPITVSLCQCFGAYS